MPYDTFASELPYPDIECAENIADAKLLMPLYGGPAGELTAITTYCFQSYVTTRNKEIAAAVGGIAKTEMHHHALLGHAIVGLGFLRENIAAEETAILNYERTVLALRTECVKTLIERIVLDEELHIKIFKDLIASL